MSRTDIRFRGVVRNANISDSSVGDCEELINIIPENGALKIIKDKEEISVNIPYKDVIIHEVGGIKNYIGKTSTSWVHFDPDTGLQIMALYNSIEDVYLALLNNQVVISDKAKIKNVTYVFNGYSYELISHGLNFPIQSSFQRNFYDEDNELITVYAPSKEDYYAGLQANINKFKIDNKTYTEGGFLYAFTLTLNDGTETGMYNLTSVHTQWTIKPNSENAFISVAENNWGTANKISTRFYYERFYQSVKLNVDANNELVNIFKKVVRKINLYVSVPITRMPIKQENIIFDAIWEGGEVNTFSFPFSFIPVMTEDSGIEKALLYKQKSWTLEDFAKGIEYQLEFGGDIQTTGATMEVSQSSIERAGEMFTFNNRVHFYNSTVRLLPALGNMYEPSIEGYSDVNADVYVYIKTGVKDNVIKYSNVKIGTRQSDSAYFKNLYLPDMIIYTDSRAYKIYIVVDGEGHVIFDLSSSPAYNYSYAFSAKINTQLRFLNPDGTEVELPTEHDDIYTEHYSINVTANGQPLVFPVEHSYLFTGAVKALAYATEPISQVHIGQYPLYVFTDKGIYAMEQGSGIVLYANQTLINTDSAYGVVTLTRNGVIYISNGGIYLLSGRNSLCLSLPISGSIDTDIRRSEAFSQCCISNKLYDVNAHLSQMDFEKFLSEAKLTYISYKDELIVSNPKCQYSYVFNFIYKTWYKITDTFSPVSGNIVQKEVFQSESVAKAAKGSLIVSTVVISTEHQFTSRQLAIYSGVAYQSNKDERFALVVGGTQVSSVNIQYPTRLPIIIALLCKDVPYLDCMYDGTSHYIYSSLDFTEGSTVKLINTVTDYTIFEITFEEYNTVVSIPAKGINDSIKITCDPGSSVVTRPLQAVDNVLTVSQLISAAINNTDDIKVMSDVNYNELTLTANTPGADGNNFVFTYDSGNYVALYSEAMQGGKDISLEPGDYSVLLDYTKEKDSYKLIHLQSRPMSFAGAYILVQRMVLHCRAKLSDEANLSTYLFASNNLADWVCVAGSQKKGVTVEHIRLQRSARAYKYYIVIIGGKVRTDTELSYISAEIEERFNSKLR